MEKYVGKKAVNPLTNTHIPIFEDEYVKQDFGTGALKVTPLHDMNDFELGKKHKLEKIQVIALNGKLVNTNSKFEGLKASVARDEIVKHLDEIGALVKIEEFTNSVGTCYKCGNVLEPLPLEQWFIKTKELAKPAIDAVKKGKKLGGTDIIPKRFEKIYFNWLNNIHDWNISRQVVWGIQIPAWKCEDCQNWTVTDNEIPKTCKSCGSTKIVQDTDTFDTWFSSGQWPFATLLEKNENAKKPNAKSNFSKYYPLSVMETGYDILFFWVARMMMLGLYVTKKVPFKTIYLHGIVRDNKGAKMSKSKGNVINPLEIVDKYGADALRMSLIAGAGAGNDQNYSEEKVRGYRNFANKIWNATRFVKEFEGKDFNKTSVERYKRLLEGTVNTVSKKIEGYKLNDAAEIAYKHFWGNFCDLNIEQAKKGMLSKENLLWELNIYLKLLHPFMPFVTEACWNELGNNTLLINEEWPTIKNGQKES